MRYIVLILILSTFSVWPFFNKGFFPSHDGEWMVVRFSAFHQTLTSGQFPVRYVDRLNNNYGYPVFNFLYPAPFYFAEIPKLLGIGFVNSIKIIFILSSIGSALAFYWTLRQLFTKIPSFLGTTAFIFSPYRFVDLYVRGSLGEITALLFAPLILGSIIKIKNNNKIFLPLLAISTFFLIISHNVIAVVFIPFFFLTSLIIAKKKIVSISAFMLAGILMSSFFWIPALFDLRYVQYSQVVISNISQHLVSISRLTIPSWGFGPLPTGESAFSPQIGITAFIAILATAYLLISKKNTKSLPLYLLSVTLISIFLMTKYSLFIWQNIIFIDTIQFPWRLLSLVMLTSSILVAYVISQVKNLFIPSVILFTLAIISTIFFIKPESFVDRGDGFYSTNESTTTVMDEYLPKWVKQQPLNRADNKIEVEGGEILNLKNQSSKYRVTISSPNEANVTINTIYFPGWNVNANGELIPINFQNAQGLIKFKLPSGIHEVIISYGRTPTHLISELISLTTILLVGSYAIIIWRKQIY